KKERNQNGIEQNPHSDNINIGNPINTLGKDSVGLYLKAIGKIPLLSISEEKELARHMEEGDKEAKKQFTEANLLVVFKIVAHYKGQDLHFLDLIQESNFGLIRAVEKFDYHKGFKFSTYATWWIHQSIKRGLAEKSKTIRRPVHIMEKTTKINRTQRDLLKDLEREPTTTEIGEETGLTAGNVQEVLQYDWEPLAVEATIGNKENPSLEDIDENQETVSPYQQTSENAFKEKLNEVLDTLTTREKNIIHFRFGLKNDRIYTLEEIGDLFEVTRERIRQIETEAMRKLRHSSRSTIIKDFIQ